MSYAPHTNTTVHYDLLAGIVPSHQPMVFGVFHDDEWDYAHEYAERRDYPDDFVPEFPHQVYVGPDGQHRLAKVMKTVAYVVVDENENGPVIEKWHIKKHKIYDTQWVGRSK